jgi:hypothetical protein
VSWSIGEHDIDLIAKLQIVHFFIPLDNPILSFFDGRGLFRASTIMRSLETSGEAARSNANQSAVAQQVHNERVANGGALSQQQKRQVNREQNANSRQIYRQKHDNAAVPPPGRREK